MQFNPTYDNNIGINTNQNASEYQELNEFDPTYSYATPDLQQNSSDGSSGTISVYGIGRVGTVSGSVSGDTTDDQIGERDDTNTQQCACSLGRVVIILMIVVIIAGGVLVYILIINRTNHQGKYFIVFLFVFQLFILKEELIR